MSELTIKNADFSVKEAEEEEQELSMRFERWLKMTCEPFDSWEFDGENFVVYKIGVEPEIYEPALVRELVEE